jgi:hypothetical protein
LYHYFKFISRLPLCWLETCNDSSNDILFDIWCLPRADKYVHSLCYNRSKNRNSYINIQMKKKKPLTSHGANILLEEETNSKQKVTKINQKLKTYNNSKTFINTDVKSTRKEGILKGNKRFQSFKRIVSKQTRKEESGRHPVKLHQLSQPLQ